MAGTATKSENLQAGTGRPGQPVLLTIAGFDPSSGAGITADLKVFAAHDYFGISCITALTVQSTQGVRQVQPVDASLLKDTLDCLQQDFSIAGVKIGMLATAEDTRAVAEFLAAAGLPRDQIVLDPVLVSSSGAALLEPDGVVCLQKELLPLAGWITPNVDELAALTGMSVKDRQMVPEAAHYLADLARQSGNKNLNVLVTGGHLDRPDDYLLAAHSREGIWISGTMVDTRATHGTGCALSSALLCEVVSDSSPASAVAAAKRYVEEAMRQAYPVGRGRGPMHHLFARDRAQGTSSSV